MNSFKLKGASPFLFAVAMLTVAASPVWAQDGGTSSAGAAGTRLLQRCTPGTRQSRLK